MQDVIAIFLYLWRFDLCLNMWSIWRKFHEVLRRRYFLFCLGEIVTYLKPTTRLKTTPIQLIEHGEVKLVSTQRHYVLMSLVQEGTLHAPKREM